MDWSGFKPDSGQPGVTDWSQFVPEKPADPRGVGGFLKDTGLDLAKGAVSLGESVVGLGDIASFGLIGKGLEKLGYDPKATNDFLSGLQTQQRQASDQAVAKADGFWNTLKELGTHPDALFGNIVQSLPGSVGAGAVGGMLVKQLAATAATEAAALGKTGQAATDFIAAKVKEQTFKIAAAASAAEGAQSAGSIAEAGRQSGRDWNQYVAPALAAGLGTAAIGMVSAKVGQKLGIGDIETDIAARSAGVKGVATGTDGILLRTGKEALKEGLLEEAPQSYQEQGFQNLATGRSWEEGAAAAAAQGMVAGAGMAGGHSVLSGRAHAPKAPASVEQPAVSPAPTTLLLGNTPDPFIAFKDGTVARKSEWEAYLAGLPADQQAAERAKAMGLAPQPAATVTDILNAPSLDEAIASAQAVVNNSVTGSTGQGLLESQMQAANPLMATARAREDRNALADQLDAQALEQKRAELEQLKDNSIAELGRLPDQQVAAATAATDESPTAMALAMERALVEHARRQMAEAPAVTGTQAAPGPFSTPAAPVAAAPVQQEAQPEPRLVDREPNMLPMSRAGAEASAAKSGGEVVRIQNRSGKFAYTVIPRTAYVSTADTTGALAAEPAAPASAEPVGSGADARRNGDDARGLGTPNAQALAPGGQEGMAVRVAGEPTAAGDAGRALNAVAGPQRKPGSWVIKEKATGKVIMETFDQKKVDALNTAKYEAVPIQEHLAGLNQEIASQGDVVSTYLGKFGKGMGKDAARLEAQRLNMRGDGKVRYAAEEHGQALENPYAVVGREAPKVAKPEVLGADIPPRYFKAVKVDHPVWIEDEQTYATKSMTAKAALADVREDIANYERLLACMKG